MPANLSREFYVLGHSVCVGPTPWPVNGSIALPAPNLQQRLLTLGRTLRICHPPLSPPPICIDAYLLPLGSTAAETTFHCSPLPSGLKTYPLSSTQIRHDIAIGAVVF